MFMSVDILIHLHAHPKSAIEIAYALSFADGIRAANSSQIANAGTVQFWEGFLELGGTKRVLDGLSHVKRQPRQPNKDRWSAIQSISCHLDIMSTHHCRCGGFHWTAGINL